MISNYNVEIIAVKQVEGGNSSTDRCFPLNLLTLFRGVIVYLVYRRSYSGTVTIYKLR